MIIIYKLSNVGGKPRYVEYDRWDGKFHGALSDLSLTEEEVIKRFNTTYYRTSEIGK